MSGNSSNNNNNDVLDFLDSLDSVPAQPPLSSVATAATSSTSSPSLSMANPFAPAPTAPATNANPFLAAGTVTSPTHQPAPFIAAPPVANVANVANVASPKLGHARSGSSSSLRDRTGTPVNVNMPPLTAGSGSGSGSASASGGGSISLPRPSTPAGSAAATSASNPQLNPYTPPANNTTAPTSASASPSNNKTAATPGQQSQHTAQAATTTNTGTGTGTGGWSSWFSTVTATVSTVVSPDLVSRATQAAAKVGDQLLHETQHAQAVASRALTQASSVAATVTAQARDRANNNATAAAAVAQGSKLLGMVSQSVNGLLDVVAPETLELAVSVKLAGMCNVDEVAKDTTQVLETVFAARDMRLIVEDTDVSGMRKFLPEESPDFTPEVAWAKVHAGASDPIPDTHIHVYIHPMLPLPATCSSSMLTYLVRVTGSGAFQAVTVSQSFHTAGPHADAEWTRMVLRSAVRTTVDDWLAELVAADASETRFSAARSRADGATATPGSTKNEVVTDEQQLVQAIGSM
ncbi:hypothetical protein BCR44DRAFT_39182 [Catenaria anguillulae PL171]|uniref:Uncharacterized protein n=1 Tax=Catenaria anguillulae PL171 TaxID=765915 RepID=A0A1Y2HLF3_9FUNG|nr:hypothetical protein BCR44DRAFT_39182 [Catenaria anguillulae PL171]